VSARAPPAEAANSSAAIAAMPILEIEADIRALHVPKRRIGVAHVATRERSVHGVLDRRAALGAVCRAARQASGGSRQLASGAHANAMRFAVDRNDARTSCSKPA